MPPYPPGRPSLSVGDILEFLSAWSDASTTYAAGDLSTVGNVVGYSGHIYEPELRMYCMRHRSYDPALGRFISNDPAPRRTTPHPRARAAARSTRTP